jgi:tetratricopeptide (TPR) repeat protein
LGKYSDAITYYDKALAIDQNHTTALNNKALSPLKLEKPNEAITLMRLYP